MLSSSVMVAASHLSHPPVPLFFDWGSLPVRVRLQRRLTDDSLYAFCRRHPDLRIEQTADGELIIMPPTGGEPGRRNFVLSLLLGVWAEKDGRGLAFDSSTAFILPNGAERSPDASWVRRPRWERLTPKQREQFPPLCPDFVAELRSRTDSLTDLQAKMAEYMANGARLGWLLDPAGHRVWIYEAHHDPVLLHDPATLGGGTVLPKFRLKLSRLW